MRGSKLDTVDKKILKLLQEDGRMTNVELAKQVGISAPPCLRRVKALEDSGLIQGYHATIDPSALGYGVTVFAMVKLTSQADKDLKEFESHVCSFDQVRECHMLAGDVDYMLKIVAKDWDSYQEFLMAHLTSAPNVNSIKSSLNIRNPKNSPGVPVDLDE